MSELLNLFLRDMGLLVSGALDVFSNLLAIAGTADEKTWKILLIAAWSSSVIVLIFEMLRAQRVIK